MSPTTRNQVKLAGVALAAAVALTMSADVAFAQSGHFLERTLECMDIGTQVECTGKVAGLGGTTFEITVDAEDAIASVECTNPGGSVAPGQDTEVDVAGTSDELPTPRNGNFEYLITTNDPEPLPPTPTCPNNQWEPNIVDLTFTTATLSLFEDGVLSDEATVMVGEE
jgi:hypothetical protein